MNTGICGIPVFKNHQSIERKDTWVTNQKHREAHQLKDENTIYFNNGPTGGYLIQIKQINSSYYRSKNHKGSLVIENLMQLGCFFFYIINVFILQIVLI